MVNLSIIDDPIRVVLRSLDVDVVVVLPLELGLNLVQPLKMGSTEELPLPHRESLLLITRLEQLGWVYPPNGV